MRPQLVVALDVPDTQALKAALTSLPDSLSWYKIGLELFIAESHAALDAVHQLDKKIFLDLKLHDIPRTVARAVASAARQNVSMLTLHAGGGPEMIKAASAAAKEFGADAPKLVAVTTLTSLDNNDLKLMGVNRPLPEQTLALGEMAIESGADGLVCSVHEAPTFRQKLGSDPILVTPGIRTVDGDAGDQKRIATPSAAVEAGSNFLVVGRPIMQATEPASAANEILAEMEKADGPQRTT